MSEEIVEYLAERVASNPEGTAWAAVTLGIGAIGGSAYVLERGMEAYDERFGESSGTCDSDLKPEALEDSEDPESDYLEP